MKYLISLVILAILAGCADEAPPSVVTPNEVSCPPGYSAYVDNTGQCGCYANGQLQPSVRCEP